MTPRQTATVRAHKDVMCVICSCNVGRKVWYGMVTSIGQNMKGAVSSASVGSAGEESSIVGGALVKLIVIGTFGYARHAGSRIGTSDMRSRRRGGPEAFRTTSLGGRRSEGKAS